MNIIHVLIKPKCTKKGTVQELWTFHYLKQIFNIFKSKTCSLYHILKLCPLNTT